MVLAMSIFVPECHAVARRGMIRYYREVEMNLHQERR